MRLPTGDIHVIMWIYTFENDEQEEVIELFKNINSNTNIDDIYLPSTRKIKLLKLIKENDNLKNGIKYDERRNTSYPPHIHIKELKNIIDIIIKNYGKNYTDEQIINRLVDINTKIWDLTNEEFNNLLSNMVSIDGFELKGKKFKFLPVLKVKNQSKYSQYIIYEDKKILLKNIQYKCENCDIIFNTTRRPKDKIKNHKILCPSCSFCNKIFKKRKYLTIFNDTIIYQSKSEMSFIEKCEQMGIKILNGEKINYFINNKNRKYYVDFHLPQYGYLIEIKDNHIWHLNEVKNGVWWSKQKFAEEYCERNNLKYKILFQNEINEFLTSIKI